MAMKKLTLAGVPLLAATMTASFTAQALTVDQLNRQVQKLNQRIAAQDQRFRVNGFATFAIAKSDEEIEYNGVSDETTWTNFSRTGVQMSFQMNQESSVVTQFVGRGTEDFDVNMDWAYFKHQISDNLSTKIGRIRGPYYMLSEYLDVGYAVPWAQMPAETYSLLSPYANIDGADLTWSTDIGWDTLEIKGFYGRTASEDFIFDDIIGVSATYQGETWMARLSTVMATLSFGSGTFGSTISGLQSTITGEAVGSQDTNFTSLGFRYDPGTLMLMGEYTTSSADGIVQDEDSMYMTFGYRFGSWLPHLTYGMHETTDDSDRELADGVTPTTATLTAAAQAQAILGADSTRIGLGVRYDFGAGTALKVQYDMVDADTTGLYDTTSYLAAGANAPDSANILTITIDTVF